ncbi:MAG: hypothetical protein QM503_03850 [Bacteroidota bacterium]
MIVSTIEKIRAILTNLADEVEFADFETYVKSAENWIKNDILGATLYDKLDNATIIDPILIRFTETIIVLKAYETGIPYMDLVQTNSGFGVIKDKTRTPASKQRVDRLIAQNKIRLDQETEWLLNFLEDTATYHTDWKSSPAFSLLTDCLIITARELKRYVKFEGNRADFLLLKPTIITLTTIQLQPQVSKLYLQELIAKQNAGTLTAADQKILPALKQSLANYAIDLDWMAKRLLEDVVTIMDNDIDNYPTYKDSDEKALKDDPGFENLEENPMFVFKGGM